MILRPRLRQSVTSVGHSLTSDALTIGTTRLSIMPGIWKVAVSAGVSGGLSEGNNPVANYDNSLIEQYWSDLVIEVGLPRFGPDQPVPDELGYGTKAGNVGDRLTYGDGNSGNPTIRYSITLWQAYLTFYHNVGGWVFAPSPLPGTVNMTPLLTKTGSINSQASGSFFETITPTEIRNAYVDKFGSSYPSNQNLLKLFNTTRRAAEGATDGLIAEGGPFNNYISIVLEDQQMRRAVAFIGPTDGPVQGLVGHVDPCQNLFNNELSGTKLFQAITPDGGIINKSISHWDSTITAVYGKGYKLT